MTPNSFSDQGLSLDPDYFKKQIQSFLDDPTLIIDVGFESTAPMNEAVSLEVERARFDYFLEASKLFSFEDRFISFDTYKIENFKYMACEFKKIHPKVHFIFNDVSGRLDNELKAALIEFKDTTFKYIYTFSHIPERAKTLEHMKFVTTKCDIIETAATSFKAAYDWFSDLEMEHQLILDPGFGFSKTYEQNWDLINKFDQLEVRLLDFKIKNPILIGLSKKSFLKKFLEIDKEESKAYSIEDLHKNCIKKLKAERVIKLLFRVHDPDIFKSL